MKGRGRLRAISGVLAVWSRHRHFSRPVHALGAWVCLRVLWIVRESGRSKLSSGDWVWGERVPRPDPWAQPSWCSQCPLHQQSGRVPADAPPPHTHRGSVLDSSVKHQGQPIPATPPSPPLGTPAVLFAFKTLVMCSGSLETACEFSRKSLLLHYASPCLRSPRPVLSCKALH